MRVEPSLTRRAVIERGSRLALLVGLATGPGVLGRAANALAQTAARQAARVRVFVSRPDLRPPAFSILHASQRTAAGHLLLAPSSGPGQRGVMILDAAGQVLWFHPTTPNTAMNFRVARYRGQPVLTWWEGKATSGLGTGTHVILDRSYRVIARLPAGGGRHSDLHEFLITPQNTALVTSYEIRRADLSPVGGPTDGEVIGGIVQELALPSGRVLFEWRSLDHVAVSETHATYSGHPLDYFHVNSVDLTSDGHLLISGRNTWAAYRVERRTGRVVWRLGGRKSDFVMGKGANFAWQHDVRHHGGGRYTVFDNGAEPQVEPQSRALLIQLTGRHARLVRKYTHHSGRLVTRFMGSAQLFDNGNVLVGWGSEPYVTEFAEDGSIVFDAKLPDGGQNYRALRFPWVGRPRILPALVVRKAGGKRHLYTSWNGATEVASWRLFAGASPSAFAPVATVPRRHFETHFVAPADARYARIAALDYAGSVLGSSKTIRL